MTAPLSTPNFRYVRGPTLVESYPVVSGVQINPGDLCILESGIARPVHTAVAWNSGAELQNWSGLRSEFLGVAIGQKNSQDVTSGGLPVALDGVFRYPFPATSGTQIKPGQPVSFTQYDPTGATIGSGVPNQQALMVCSGLTTAIGTVVEFYTPTASGQGELAVNLQSTVIYGPINAV